MRTADGNTESRALGIHPGSQAATTAETANHEATEVWDALATHAAD